MVLDGRGVRGRVLCFIHLLDLLMLSRYTTAVNKPSTILRYLPGNFGQLPCFLGFPTEFDQQGPLAKLGSVATGVEVGYPGERRRERGCPRPRASARRPRHPQCSAALPARLPKEPHGRVLLQPAASRGRPRDCRCSR